MTEQEHTSPSGESTEDKHVNYVSHSDLLHCKKSQQTMITSPAWE